MQTISNTAFADNNAYFAACASAEKRSLHSFFNQHVITDDEAGYIAVDEGDYDALPMHIIDRLVYTVAGKMSDEF